jgi:hypothetical protein
VEFVKLIAKNTIDEYMFKLQQRKLKEINQYIGQKNLMSRNTLKELLSMFGDVNEEPGFGFFISPRGDATTNGHTAGPGDKAKRGMS